MATQQDIQHHYDIDNDFYALFLDKDYRVYSCGVWENARTLEDAQEAKLDRIARYAKLEPKQRVLDVGCGWGGMMRFARERFGVASVDGLTLSADQYDFIKAEAYPDTEVHLTSWEDYPPPSTPYDAIVSVGAFEHFASLEDRSADKHREVYARFFDWCRSVSTPDAYLGLQTIVTARAPENITELRDVRYLLEHVFPGSALPSVSDIQAAIVDQYEIVAIARIGLDYAKTLGCWAQRLDAHRGLVEATYGQALYDNFSTYFASAQRNFAAGVTDLVQLSLQRVNRRAYF